MIEIHINKDVGSYDAKFIGPFTMRQTVCIVIAAPICWFIYKITSPVVSGDVAGFFMAIPAAIAWMFGWLRPYGMRTEKFVQSVFITMMLAPANRKYKTKDAYDVQDPEAEGKSGSGKPAKNKKPRYKVSPNAVK